MFYFSWQNINVTTLEKTKTFWKTTIKKKLILDNGKSLIKQKNTCFLVSGFATSNSLFAIMGSSGSGKTSLCRAISGRCKLKTGVLKINDSIVTDDYVKEISGYISQQDIFTEYLTVLEHMEFMAALKLKKPKHKFHIKQLLSDFCLDSHSWIKNLSGGEKRRLSLAGELISDPFILFCDEPTTGLDSYNSLIVIEKLQQRTLTGKIVLTTIHQPSSQIFHYFDNITLLAEGKLVFQGTREEAYSFFANMNLCCPSNYNPADFYIKCLTVEDVPKMCKIFESQKNTPISDFYNHVDTILFDKKNKNTFIHELKWLMWRNFLSTKRNTGFFLGTFIFLIELGLISLFFFGTSFSSPQSAQNIQGFLGLLASEFVFTNMYAVVNVFPSEIEIFIKEGTLYSSLAYFMSKILSIIPLVLITTIVNMSLLFSMLKFLSGIYLWLQITCWMFLVSMSGCALGLAFSGTFSTVEQIDLYLGSIEFLFLLLSGLMVKLDKVPVVFRWLKYFSPFYYAFDSSSHLIWENVSNIGNCTGSRTIPCYNNGTEVLQSYGILRSYPAFYNLLSLHVITIIFLMIGFVGIVRKKHLCSI